MPEKTDGETWELAQYSQKFPKYPEQISCPPDLLTAGPEWIRENNAGPFLL
jgi:hypothetical protein